MRLKTLKSTTVILLLLFAALAGTESAMAVTWSDYIYRSTTVAYYDGFPSIAQTGDGKVWLVWSKSISGNLTLYYKTSINLGGTWSDEMNLTEPLTPGNNQNPSIIQAVNGTIWVVWTSDRPLPPPPPLPDFNLTASPPSLTIPKGGSDTSNITVTSISNFSNPVSLSVLFKPPGVTTTLNPTQVTPPQNGTTNSTLTVSVDITATPGNYNITVMGRGGKRIHTVEVALEITESAGAGELGGGALTYMSSSPPDGAIEDYEIFYKTSNDNGATWSNDTPLTNNNFDDMRPSFFQLENGTFLLVWQSFESGNNDIYCKTTLNGTVWSNSTQLTTYLGHDRGPSATQTMDGKIWVTWSTDRTGDNEIFYKTYNGTLWSEDTRLTYSTDSDVAPSILQTIDGNIYIFWCSMPPTGGADIYYKYSTNNGTTWLGNIQFTTDNNEDMWPSATQTRDTKIWVVWVSNRADQPDGNWDIYYRTSLAGDVNQDEIVDIVDLSLVGQAYGRFKGEEYYNPDADINKDDIVDIGDITIVCIYYGAT
jgi:hypothetical protein